MRFVIVVLLFAAACWGFALGRVSFLAPPLAMPSITWHPVTEVRPVATPSVDPWSRFDGATVCSDDGQSVRCDNGRSFRR